MNKKPTSNLKELRISKMAEQVKLLGHWASPFNCRIETALKLKGVQYEFIQEDLQNKSPLLLKCNPIHKKIPVLLHNGKPICESLVILEYIDETWKGTPIFPEDPHERAIGRFWANFIDEKCLPAIKKAFFTKDDKAIEEASELLKTLEAQLNDNKFFRGDNVGLVDIVANLFGYWVGVIQEAMGVELLTEEKFPRLRKCIDEYDNCNVIKECLPPREKLLAFAKVTYKPSQPTN
ncbi:probable glutathione S-transferase [Camellia sinensis]|uniref:probable glutathione S-transferase n=1 Tax=Camellia sinensis TaxID=4442 RepID=UPI001036E876|nr:probable glutathione S-transferase [Camellia sinensis]